MGKRKALTVSSKTPAELGFRMVAEWERHEATWIGWPHNKTDWPGKFGPIPWVYAEIARRITSDEILRVLVNSNTHAAEAKRVLTQSHVDLSKVEFFRFPTNRGWTRDSGPLFVRADHPQSEVAIVKFGFNAWAKYPDFKKDVNVPERAAKSLGLRLFSPTVNGRTVVLEGGSLDVNGRGTLITTEECLLDTTIQPRNPTFSRHDYEAILATHLGATNVLWLGRGIAGDDTHGHVDDLCRFVNPTTLVLAMEEDAHDANHQILHENSERLEAMRLEDGSRPEVISLPMPTPVYFKGQRLPASYANFYISNAAVLVPTFNDPNDRIALGILGELFRDRPVIGIHAVDLVWGLGTLHCLTHEQPATAFYQ